MQQDRVEQLQEPGDDIDTDRAGGVIRSADLLGGRRACGVDGDIALDGSVVKTSASMKRPGVPGPAKVFESQIAVAGILAGQVEDGDVVLRYEGPKADQACRCSI